MRAYDNWRLRDARRRAYEFDLKFQVQCRGLGARRHGGGDGSEIYDPLRVPTYTVADRFLGAGQLRTAPHHTLNSTGKRRKRPVVFLFIYIVCVLYVCECTHTTECNDDIDRSGKLYYNYSIFTHTRFHNIYAIYLLRFNDINTRFDKIASYGYDLAAFVSARGEDVFAKLRSE